MGLLKFITLARPELSSSAGNKIVDALKLAMLKLVFVAAEDDSYASSLKPLHKLFHSLGIVMLRSGAKWRVVREWNLPSRSIWLASRFIRQSEFQELCVFRVLKEASPFEDIGFLGGVDA